MNKKIVALFAAALLPLAASASEITPGAIEVSGRSKLVLSSLNHEITTKETGFPNVVDEVDTTTFDFETGMLYYVTNSVGVGLELGYSREKAKSGPITTTDSLLFIGPKVGADLGIAEKASVFGEASVVYATGTSKEEDATDPGANFSYDTSGFGFNVAAGLKYFPTRAFSLNAGVDYTYMSLTFKPFPGIEMTSKSSGIGAFAGISIYFGN